MRRTGPSIRYLNPLSSFRTDLRNFNLRYFQVLILFFLYFLM